jgi:hypothetical protein
MNEPGYPHSVRRIVLPSGQSIEVVRFDDEAAQPAVGGLHECPSCDSQLVQPVDWDTTEDERWELTLHCPNCDWSCRGIYGTEQLAQLEEQLDLGMEAIVSDLQRFTSANMADELERFAAALEADLILPEDF